ncbi:hypothetical protein L9F63_019502, partial [Diploptera punctata]
YFTFLLLSSLFLYVFVFDVIILGVTPYSAQDLQFTCYDSIDNFLIAALLMHRTDVDMDHVQSYFRIQTLIETHTLTVNIVVLISIANISIQLIKECDYYNRKLYTECRKCKMKVSLLLMFLFHHLWAP